MYRAGLSVILSQLIRDDRLLVTDAFSIDTHKTKTFVEKLSAFGLNEVMLITNQVDDNLYFSSRNVPRVSVVEVKNIDPVSLLKFERILLTSEGLRKLEELLS
jgi:large subunit ribosomal protein L4